MVQKIDAPGVYDGIDAADYHGDLCVGPSLSSSGAKLLLDKTPLHFWHQSYMNPSRKGTHIGEVGTGAHLMLLEPKEFRRRVQIIDADNYRTNAAKEQRDAARAVGLTPLLAKEAEKIAEMRAAIEHSSNKLHFVGGIAERTFVSTSGGLWWKARPDYLIDDGKRLVVVDYKTTTNANPRDFARIAASMGYYQQEAWYRSVIFASTGRRVDDFVFVAQEDTPPYAACVVRWRDTDVEWGSLMNVKACAIFAQCVATGAWPGYGSDVIEIGLPVYEEMRLEERKANDEFTIQMGSRRPRRSTASVNLSYIGD